MEAVKLFFGFLTMVVIALIVINMIANPKGTQALGDSTLGNFNKTLQLLAPVAYGSPQNG